MKKSIIILVLLLSVNYVKSQIFYSNYYDMSCEWRNYSGGWNGFSGYSNKTTTYFDGFQEINGYVYYKQYSKNLYTTTDFGGNPITQLTLSGVKYIREGSNGKIYKIEASDLNVETVIFDNQEIVNSQIGNPFPYPGATCNIQAIQYVSLGTSTLKKINGTVNNYQNGSVEGIGNIGLACATGIEFSSNLVCFTKLGNSVQFGTINCNTFPIPNRVNLSNLEYLNNKITIYPNPTKNTLNITTTTPLQKTIIYNLLGAKVYEQAFNEIVDVSSLSSGVYVVKFYGEDNVVFVEKIVKE